MALFEISEELIEWLLTEWIGEVIELWRIARVCKKLWFIVRRAIGRCLFLTIDNSTVLLLSKLAEATNIRVLHLADLNDALLTQTTYQAILSTVTRLEQLTVLSCNGVKKVLVPGLTPILTLLRTSQLKEKEDIQQLPLWDIQSLFIHSLHGVQAHCLLFDALTQLTHLLSLGLYQGTDLGHTNLFTILFSSFSSYLASPSLKVLDVRGYITSAFVQDSAYVTAASVLLRRLRKLSLIGPYVDVELLLNYCSPELLQDVDLGGNYSNITDTAFNQLALTFHKLKHFRMSNVSHFGLSVLANKCTELETISMTQCEGVGDLTMVTLGKRCLQLRSVDVTGCSGISDQGVVGLCVPYSKIVSLTLSHCTKVTNVGLKAVGNCKKIKHLSVVGMFKITDGGVIALSTQCTTLTTLDVSWCFELTMLSIERFVETCYPLYSVGLEGCTRFHSEVDIVKLNRAVKCKFAFKQHLSLENLSKKKNSKKKERTTHRILPDFDDLLNGPGIAPPAVKNTQRKTNRNNKHAPPQILRPMK